MTNSLCPQQDSVVQIIVRGSTITKSLSSMEKERDIKTQLFLTVHEAEEWDKVVYERFRRIFWTDQVKSYSTNTRVEFELISRCWWDCTNLRPNLGTLS